MSVRVFSDISNIPARALEGKRVTRASRKVLSEISGKNIPRAAVGSKGKSNVVGNLRLNQKKASRQTKVGVKRTLKDVMLPRMRSSRWKRSLWKLNSLMSS